MSKTSVVKHSRFGTAVVVAATALVLAACTSQAPTSTSAPTGAPPTVAATPTPTATPTASAVADPTIRVPLQCANLFTPASAGALLNVPVTAAIDETTEPTDLEDAANLQRGILTCTWGGKDRTDGGYDQALSLYVDPDGATDFPANLPWFSAHIMDHPTKNAFGDQSVSGCMAGGGLQCFADVLVGGYWVTVDLHDLDSSHKVTKATATSRLQQIMKVVVPALQSAVAPGAPWVAPTAAKNGFCDKKNNVVDVRKALASPGLDYDSDPADTGSEVTYLADLDGPLFSCSWYQSGSTPKGQSSSATVDLLQGGAWVIPQFVADPPTQWYVGQYKVISVDGTTGAVLACNSADCQAIVGIGANAAAISFDDLGSKRNLANVTAMVKAIAAT